MTNFKRKKIKLLDDCDSGSFADGIRFRLKNVRAYEKHQFGGFIAKRILAGMMGRIKGVVQVRTVARGHYGREIVEIKNKDGSVNS